MTLPARTPSNVLPFRKLGSICEDAAAQGVWGHDSLGQVTAGRIMSLCLHTGPHSVQPTLTVHVPKFRTALGVPRELNT